MRVSMDSDGLQSTRQTLFGPRPGEWAEWVDPAVPGPRGVKRWLGVLGLVVDSDDGAALLFSLSPFPSSFLSVILTLPSSTLSILPPLFSLRGSPIHHSILSLHLYRLDFDRFRRGGPLSAGRLFGPRA
jgi:hypothetical protein